MLGNVVDDETCHDTKKSTAPKIKNITLGPTLIVEGKSGPNLTIGLNDHTKKGGGGGSGNKG